jgi:hypothetical protein
MASMDTGLNRNSGLLICNFYQRFVRPLAPERELLLASKTCTFALGLAIIALASGVAVFNRLDLFNLVLTFGSLVSLPLMIPTVFGLFIQSAPTWSGWTTPLVGLVAGWTLRYAVGVTRLAAWLGWSELSPLEAISFGYAATVLGVVAACGAWYAASAWVARHAPEPEHVRAFFADLRRPIDRGLGQNAIDQRKQYRTMGALCLIYGGGIALFAVLPGAFTGRASFLFCGGTIAAIGALLRWMESRRREEVAV